MTAIATKPTLAVWKFSSCDGCQLSLLDCEDELLAIAGALQIAYFPEATSAELEGPYDISLVEGSVTTPHDVERIHEIREQSGLLVTIGACATAGGIQALRNFADVKEWIPLVYASPEFISTLETSTPIADHVKVDLELRGCPISKEQLSRDGAGTAPWPPAEAALDERVLRMQGARHDVRHGRPRHAVPRARHPVGLRSDLPGLQPRLLRLLRPDGEPERERVGGAVAGSRRGRRRHRAGVAHLQRERSGVQRGEQ